MHDGRIGVTSDGAGTGAEFRVDLPAIEEEVAAHASSARTESKRLSVLLVDDNQDSCELVGFWFDQIGHDVTMANDGGEGLDLALARPFDVAIIDIGLPTMDGYDVARSIRRARLDRPPLLIALTGYGRADARQRALDAGFDVHLVKPIDVTSLNELMLRLCEARWSRSGALAEAETQRAS